MSRSTGHSRRRGIVNLLPPETKHSDGWDGFLLNSTSGSPTSQSQDRPTTLIRRRNRRRKIKYGGSRQTENDKDVWKLINESDSTGDQDKAPKQQQNGAKQSNRSSVAKHREGPSMKRRRVGPSLSSLTPDSGRVNDCGVVVKPSPVENVRPSTEEIQDNGVADETRNDSSNIHRIKKHVKSGYQVADASISKKKRLCGKAGALALDRSKPKARTARKTIEEAVVRSFDCGLKLPSIINQLKPNNHGMINRPQDDDTVWKELKDASVQSMNADQCPLGKFVSEGRFAIGVWKQWLPSADDVHVYLSPDERGNEWKIEESESALLWEGVLLQHVHQSSKGNKCDGIPFLLSLSKWEKQVHSNLGFNDVVCVFGTAQDFFSFNCQVKKQSIPAAVAFSMVKRVLRCLASLHKYGVTHNNFNLDSFLLGYVPSDEEWTLTLTGLGTKGGAYFPKETGSDRSDWPFVRDLWLIGSVAWTLLTGNHKMDCIRNDEGIKVKNIDFVVRNGFIPYGQTWATLFHCFLNPPSREHGLHSIADWPELKTVLETLDKSPYEEVERKLLGEYRSWDFSNPGHRMEIKEGLHIFPTFESQVDQSYEMDKIKLEYETKVERLTEQLELSKEKFIDQAQELNQYKTKSILLQRKLDESSDDIVRSVHRECISALERENKQLKATLAPTQTEIDKLKAENRKLKREVLLWHKKDASIRAREVIVKQTEERHRFRRRRTSK